MNNLSLCSKRRPITHVKPTESVAQDARANREATPRPSAPAPPTSSSFLAIFLSRQMSNGEMIRQVLNLGAIDHHSESILSASDLIRGTRLTRWITIQAGDDAMEGRKASMYVTVCSTMYWTPPACRLLLDVGTHGA